MRIVKKGVGLFLLAVLTALSIGCAIVVFLSTVLLGILSRILLPLSVLVMIFDAIKPGLALLAVALLCSRYGLPLAAAWLTGKVSGLRNCVIENVLA